MEKQSKPNIQIDDVVREMTDEEFKSYQDQQKAAKAEQLEVDARLATRESALAKLAKLGLTEEEIASL
jgi:DNA-binding NarL/FixJ family response regulator